MHLRLALNLLHFFPELSVLYTLRCVPIFYEIHPLFYSTSGACMFPLNSLSSFSELLQFKHHETLLCSLDSLTFTPLYLTLNI
jgi:hypothetical protein